MVSPCDECGCHAFSKGETVGRSHDGVNVSHCVSLRTGFDKMIWFMLSVVMTAVEN